MAQIQSKFLADDAVTGDKVKLANNQALRARNAADSADIDLIKVDGSDLAQLPAGAQVNGSDILRAADKGVSNGVASLDGAGKVPVAQLPNSIMEYQGTWNATTNTPTLADGGGNTGDVYRVTVAGSQDLGSGSITFDVGDYAIYNASGVWEKADTTDAVASVNGATGVVVLDTDDVSEGATNLYYTDARAKAATVADSITDAVTDVAPSQNAVFDALALKTAVADLASTANGQGASLVGVEDSGANYTATDVEGVLAEIAGLISASTSADAENEVVTLNGTDITNQYVDLGFEAMVDSVQLYAGGLKQVQGTDYTLSYTGGAGSVTRVTFAGDLATAGAAELVATDVIEINYLRA